MKSELPKVESKQCSEMYKLLKEMIPHYTPEWAGSDPKDAGIALLKIFSQMNEDVINRLNQVPKKNFVAFLDMLGIKPLPAQPAKAPLTFKLAQGTETEILIPERTQVSAGKTPEHDELPFETEKNLLATPSQLKAVVSVDSVNDAIYIPPPGFLDGKMQKQSKVSYKIVSSPSAGSDNFQLDNVTDLKPEDFLRIGDTAPEYVIISEISGMIIHIKDSLSKDYPTDTPVKKITDFNLFDGKNMQEHSLYLSHKDLFNIKSKAQFIIFINHRVGAERVPEPLKVSWEYWGEIKGEEGEHWHKFDTVDGTFGLSKDGIVTLNKMTEGEIKEREINGVKSRWIRCILVKPLNIDASLPVLDNVVFKVNSSGENFAPDQAFTNDKPIDITKPFSPFGSEPKVFDTFSLASKEVFSKKGAKVTINVDVEREIGILGSPNAIFYGDKGERRVFARGTSGRLIEIKIDPDGKETWIDTHDSPPGTRIASESRPSAVYDDGSIYVFARTEDGRLAERYYSGSQWYWIDFRVPKEGAIDYGVPKEGVKLLFDPAAIYIEEYEDKENSLFVFVTGSDNKLYEYVSSKGIGVGKWIAHGNPVISIDGTSIDASIDSSPYVVRYSQQNGNIRIKVFVKGKDGKLYELDCEPGNPNFDKWDNPEDPSNPCPVKVDSKPFAAKMLYEHEDEVVEHVEGVKKATVNTEQNAALTMIKSADPITYNVVDLDQKRTYTYTVTNTGDVLISEPIMVSDDHINGGKPFQISADGLGVGATVKGKATYTITQADIDAGSVTNIAYATGTFGGSEVKSKNATATATVKIPVMGYVVFVKGSDHNLWKFNYNPKIGKRTWEKLNNSGHPSIASEPHGYISHQKIMEIPGQVNIDEIKGSVFARDINNDLQEYQLVEEKYEQRSYKLPKDLELRFSPFVLFNEDEPTKLDEPTKFHVFSTSKKGSIIGMKIENKTIISDEYRDPGETAPSPVLSWEYWNNKGWVVIKGLKDETYNFLESGKIIFDLPEDIDVTEVAGQKNIWIRVRLVGGDYGKETFVLLQDSSSEPDRQQPTSTKQEIISNKSGVRSPIVDSLKLNYTFEESRYPDKTITSNNLEYIDQTEASKIEDKFFYPFVKLEDFVQPEDRVKSIYLGFENYFKSGPIRIFFAAKELPFKEETKPKLEWTYSAGNEWNELDHQDDTEGLIRADTLELLMDSDFSAQSRFGSYFFWIKGSLPKEREYEESPLLYGIYPNTTWALQNATIKDEILGSSDGTGNQEFSFLNLPVLPGQNVRVKEILSEEEKQAIVASFGENSIEYVKDEKGKIIENWVLWTEVSDFFDSKRQDRRYTLDHATGKLQFGDGNNGMIPQALDDNIKAFSYQSGGGKQGNVEAGEIKSLKSAVAGVDSVFNPVAADGGADAADLDQMLDIGPTMIGHRDRAVTVEDFQLLAKQASRKVTKVKCLPNTNNIGQKEIGWVTLIIVPDSKEDKPIPSQELRKIVQNYLEERCENTLAYKKHIRIASPSYVEISVSVDVFVGSIDKAFKVEREVKQKLNAFFHPLTGGREQKGWDFGRDVADSDIYALIENIAGVDHVENLKVKANAEGEFAEGKENYLVSNGTHTINLEPINESDPYGSA